MRYSLRHLEIFAAVARHGNISSAAGELSMSQSAASTALIELERRYDRPLFDRVGKRVRLNENGRLLLPAALQLLNGAAEIDSMLLGKTGPGPIKLGATQTIGSYIAPVLINEYLQQYPDCSMTLEIGNTHEISRKITEFSLDIALIEGEYSHPDLLVTNWIEDELVIICGPANPLARRHRCTLDDVLTERWVVRERGSGTRQALDLAMRPYISRWHIGMELQQIEAILETVAVGSFVGCVPRIAARHALARRTVVELKVPELELHRRFYMVTHRQKSHSSGVRAFMDICAERANGSVRSH